MRRASSALEAPRRLLGGVRAAKRHREQQTVNRALLRELRRTADASAPADAHGAGGRAAGSWRHRHLRPGSRTATTPRQRPPPATSRQCACWRSTATKPLRSPSASKMSDNSCRRMEAQLARVQLHGANALARQDGRRAARLAHRATRIEGEVETDVATTSGLLARPPRPSARAATRGRRPTATRSSGVPGRPGGARPARPRGRGWWVGVRERDYPALAGLVGICRANTTALHAGEQRVARLEIDRELGARGVKRRASGQDAQRAGREVSAGSAWARSSTARGSDPRVAGRAAADPAPTDRHGTPVRHNGRPRRSRA